jgi:hypothetical protein
MVAYGVIVRSELIRTMALVRQVLDKLRVNLRVLLAWARTFYKSLKLFGNRNYLNYLSI